MGQNTQGKADCFGKLEHALLPAIVGEPLFKARFLVLFAGSVAALSACGGGGGGSSIPGGSSAPTDSNSFVVQASPTSVPLPSVGGYTGTLLMPAVTGSGSVAVNVSLQPPTGVPIIQARSRSSTYRLRQQISTVTTTPLLYITLTPSQTITIRNVPGFMITVPSSASILGQNVYVSEYYDAWRRIDGPGTFSGLAITLTPPNATYPVTLETGQAVTFGVFSTGAASIQFAIGAQPVVNTPSTVHLTVNAVDEYGNVLLGPGYPTIDLTNDDTTGTVVLAASSVNTPNASVAATYNGKWISTGNASANITASIVGTSITGTFAISPQPVFTTYPGGNTNNACCLSITSGPDGAVWYTNGNNSIGRISTSSAVSTFGTPSTAMPFAIVSGPDGALWFSDGGAGATDIGRLTTSGTYSSCSGGDLTQGSALVAGSDGNLWVSGLNGTIVRIVPGTCAQTVFGSSSPVPGANSLALGSDGAVWFAQGSPGLGVQGYVGRISTSGVVTMYPTPSTPPSIYSIPIDITAGPDGNLWYIDWGSSKVGRVTTNGVITEFGPQTITDGTGVQPIQSALTTGPDGALWFSTGTGVGRISTTGLMTNYPLSLNPYGLVLGSDHALWGQTYFTGQIVHIAI